MQHPPTQLHDHTYRQSVRTWLQELLRHDLTDTRGLLSGLAILSGLVASRVEPGPGTAPLSDERFEIKVRLWREALQELYGRKG